MHSTGSDGSNSVLDSRWAMMATLLLLLPLLLLLLPLPLLQVLVLLYDRSAVVVNGTQGYSYHSR